MEKGTVAKLLKDKYLGFIKRDNGEGDIFFHANSLAEGVKFEDLKEEEAVTFDVEEGPKGLNATNIQRA